MITSMTQKVDVKALAELARLDVTGEELAKLEREIPAILAFVETIQAASSQDTAESKKASGLRNIVREDTEPHEGGIYTDVLLSAAPARESDRIVVKQVIRRKQ